MPLCVDLDGTLVKTDMLMETLVAVVRRRPWLAALCPFWLLRGRAALKRELASRAPFDPALLPYDEALLAELRREHAAGRPLVLATASDGDVARRIADHLGLFGEVLASDGTRNLKGEAKGLALAGRFGERGFDYVGNDHADIAVWRHARDALVAGSDASVAGALQSAGIAHRVIAFAPARPFVLARALRLHQWAKNLLVFVPLVAAHRYLDAGAVAEAALAFVAFSLVASAVYLANDLLDLASDRRHPSKRHRAIASGDLPIAAAVAILPILLGAAAIVALVLPWGFGAALLAYIAANLAYSLALKRIAVLDVFVLAGFYALRLLAGAAAIAVPVSHWLLAFSLFVFLSLALAKRYVEVAGLAARDESVVAGRGYAAGDGTFLFTLGVVSAYLSILVFALYVSSREVLALYRHPGVLWAAGLLLLYWMTRLWFLAFRGRLHEDPVVFALRDRVSYAIGAAVLLLMAAAT